MLSLHIINAHIYCFTIPINDLIFSPLFFIFVHVYSFFFFLKIRPEQQLWKQLWNFLSHCFSSSFIFFFKFVFCAEIPLQCSSPKKEIILSDNSSSNIMQNTISVIAANVFVTVVCFHFELSLEGRDSIICYFIELVKQGSGTFWGIFMAHSAPEISAIARRRTGRHRYFLNSV